MTAMDDKFGAVERGCKELLVALELQRLRHHMVRIRQHAVGGHDDITVDTKRRHDVVAIRREAIPKSSAPRSIPAVN
jgi:hypothetical protein